MRLVSHNDIHLTHIKLLYPVCLYSGGGGRRRIATLGDDSDDGDDEPQNYFAGGERRLPAHWIVILITNSLFSLSQWDQCPESG